MTSDVSLSLTYIHLREFRTKSHKVTKQSHNIRDILLVAALNGVVLLGVPATVGLGKPRSLKGAIRWCEGLTWHLTAGAVGLPGLLLAGPRESLS